MRKHITWKELRKLTLRQFLYRLAAFARRSAQNLYYRLSNPQFQKLVDQADGLCSVPVYMKIHQEVLTLPDLDIVEIGAAAGASTIACGLAMQQSQKKSSIVVVEKCLGGSRERYGGFADNLQRLKHNLSKFGIQDRIRLFADELNLKNGAEVLQLIHTNQIAALICDADGRIDRDFELFWPKLIAGAVIIIDDFIPSYKAADRSEWLRLGHDKQVLTTELLQYFIDVGLFQTKTIVDNAVFGIKPPQADFSRCDFSHCSRIVQAIMFELNQIRSMAA